MSFCFPRMQVTMYNNKTITKKMKKKILNTIWVMGVLSIAVFCLSACDHELDIQQAYPFTIETMPVQKHIAKGQTAEIRCTLKRQGRFEDARYTIRYFQPDGRGRFRADALKTAFSVLLQTLKLR